MRQVTEDVVLRERLLVVGYSPRHLMWKVPVARARRERPTLRQQVEWALLPAFLTRKEDRANDYFGANTAAGFSPGQRTCATSA